MQTLDTCRHLYNNSLDERNKQHINFYEQKKLLTQRRKEDKYLKQVHSQVVQDVLLRLDKSFQAFFLRIRKYPKFKRHAKYNSFTYPQAGAFNLDGNRIRLAMIGSVKIRLHREPIGTPKRCTVIRDIDQWFVCITTEVEQNTQTQDTNKNPPVGIDLGITTLATLSDDKEFENPRYLKQSTVKIKQQQRILARKTKGSNNRRKARIILAKTWRKVRRQRDDTTHKISRYLADNYSMIVFEDLKIPNMVKNHHLASAIMDAAWGKLRLLTAYKAEQRNGGQVILVDPSGTTQKCSGCGNVVPKDLSERMHECPYCGLCIGRDLNSAREILQRGLEQARVEGEPLLVRKRISKFDRGSKKPTNFSCG